MKEKPFLLRFLAENIEGDFNTFRIFYTETIDQAIDEANRTAKLNNMVFVNAKPISQRVIDKLFKLETP